MMFNLSFSKGYKPPICRAASRFMHWDRLLRLDFYRQRFKYRVLKEYEDIRTG
jgi:hypothetical protein